jgi:hypothetical protein
MPWLARLLPPEPPR